MKTPVALLVLVGLAVWLAASRRLRSRADAFLWIPVALYAAVSLSRGINIGHRHLLPLYPFLFVAAGRAAAWAVAAWPRRGAGRGRRPPRRVARGGRAVDPSPLPRLLQRAGRRAPPAATGSWWIRAWTGDRTCAA